MFIYIHIHIYIYNIRTCKPFIYIYKLSICKWAVLHTRGVLLRSKKSSQVPDEFIRLQVSKWGSPSPRVDHALIWSISHLSWFTTNFPGWKSRIFPILRRLQRLVVQGPQKFIPQNFPIFEPHFRLGKLGDHFNIEDRWLVRLDELMRHLDCLGESLKWQVAMELWPPFHLNWSIIATMQRKLCFVRVKTFFFPRNFHLWEIKSWFQFEGVGSVEKQLLNENESCGQGTPKLWFFELSCDNCGLSLHTKGDGKIPKIRRLRWSKRSDQPWF